MKLYCQNANCKKKTLVKVQRFNEECYDFYFCSINCWQQFRELNQKEIEDFKKEYETIKETTRTKHGKK